MIVWKDKLKNWKGELRRRKGTKRPRGGQALCLSRMRGKGSGQWLTCPVVSVFPDVAPRKESDFHLSCKVVSYYRTESHCLWLLYSKP